MKAAANGSRPGVAGDGRQERCDRVRRLRLRQGHRRHPALRVPELRPGLPGTERVYVERPIFDKFVAALKAGAEGMKIGVPDDPAANLARW